MLRSVRAGGMLRGAMALLLPAALIQLPDLGGRDAQAAAPTSSGSVRWEGHPSAGRGAWSTQHMVSSSRATDVTIAGRRAWRMEIRDGDDYGGYGERTELGQDGSSRVFRKGDDVWLGYSILMPKGFNTSLRWQVFTQMKDQSPGLGSPSWGTYLQGGRIGIQDRATSSGDFRFSAPATLGAWHNFVTRYKLGTSSSTGRIEIYYSTGDATPTLRFAANQRTYRTSAIMVPRMGYYRDARGTGGSVPVYHAGFRVGTGFGAVNPVKR